MILAPKEGQRVRRRGTRQTGIVVSAAGMLATVRWDSGGTTTINGAYLEHERIQTQTRKP